MKNKIFWFLVIAAAFLASLWLFKPGYFVMHDDLQMMRQLQLEKCFADGQFPCRWVPDMGFGYGYPLFNFYPPLPFYIGMLFRWLGFSFVWTAKLLFALQFFLSGATMFVLASSLWGIWGGLLSSVFYLWAPYHSVDVYVRGAMNEAWAFVWFPLIFWSARNLVMKGKTKDVIWLAFSFAALLLTHNVMAMIIIPLMFAWILFWLVAEKKRFWQEKALLAKLTLAGLWGTGLAAFFTFPVLLEKKFTHIETMFTGYYDWRAHFTTLHQLFISRMWGYGPSYWGPDDPMPFPIGQLHWLLAGVILLFVAVRVVKAFLKKKKLVLGKLDWLIVGLFFAGLGYAFLTHQRATFIWLAVKPLQLAQFPWRLLAGVVFAFSLLAGAIYYLTKKRWLVVVLSLLVIGTNWSFFRPEKMGPLPDEQKFSGQSWDIQRTAGLYDYLPSSASTGPKSAPSEDWIFLDGEAEGDEFSRGTDWFLWLGKVRKPGTLRVSGFYFPGWKVWVDKRPAKLSYEKELGRMEVVLPEGEHEVYFRFTNTPVRAWSNLVSLVAWWALLAVIVGPKLWRIVPKK